jgi:hypothetical protein
VTDGGIRAAVTSMVTPVARSTTTASASRAGGGAAPSHASTSSFGGSRSVSATKRLESVHLASSLITATAARSSSSVSGASGCRWVAITNSRYCRT